MKLNASVIASISLLSFFSSVMAEEDLNVLDGTYVTEKKANDDVFKKDEPKNESNEAKHQEEYEEEPQEEYEEEHEDEDEYEEEHEEEHEEEYEDAIIVDKDEADPKDYTEYESDGTEAKRESNYEYIDGWKVSLSVLACFAFLFVI